MEPVCRRCGKAEAIVRVSLNRGGPREFDWCQGCLNAFRAWAALPAEGPTVLEFAESLIDAALAAEVKR